MRHLYSKYRYWTARPLIGRVYSFTDWSTEPDISLGVCIAEGTIHQPERFLPTQTITVMFEEPMLPHTSTRVTPDNNEHHASETLPIAHAKKSFA